TWSLCEGSVLPTGGVYLTNCLFSSSLNSSKGETMVIEYIRYSIPEASRPEFEQAYTEASRSLDSSDHCLGYELAHGLEEPDHYVLRIEWDSLSGHEQGFRGSPEFGSFLQAIKPYIGEIAEMRHYEQTGVRSIDGGAR